MIKLKSLFIVTIQFVCILILITTTKFYTIALLPRIIFVLSLALMIWAIYTMQKSKFRIFPEPSLHAKLITKGPYQFIRHPMYTSLILGCIGLLIHSFSWMHFSITVLLIGVLMHKLHWEESLLSVKFKEYEHYKKTSKCLIPFVF